MADKLRITLRKSPISYTAKTRGTVRAMGLRRIGQTVELADNPATRGMARAVRFLVEVEGPASARSAGSARSAESARSEGRGGSAAAAGRKTQDEAPEATAEATAPEAAPEATAGDTTPGAASKSKGSTETPDEETA